MLQILGRATADVELSESKAGKKYVRMSVAVNQLDKDKKDPKTFYYDTLLFGKSAENAQKLIKKGDLVFVYGRPDFDAYIAKDKKTAKTSLTLLAENWQVIK